MGNRKYRSAKVKSVGWLNLCKSAEDLKVIFAIVYLVNKQQHKVYPMFH
jgi:hypothetical protein